MWSIRNRASCTGGLRQTTTNRTSSSQHPRCALRKRRSADAGLGEAGGGMSLQSIPSPSGDRCYRLARIATAGDLLQHCGVPKLPSPRAEIRGVSWHRACQLKHPQSRSAINPLIGTSSFRTSSAPSRIQQLYDHRPDRSERSTDGVAVF